jgi:hypothetical protein
VAVQNAADVPIAAENGAPENNVPVVGSSNPESMGCASIGIFMTPDAQQETRSPALTRFSAHIGKRQHRPP